MELCICTNHNQAFSLKPHTNYAYAPKPSLFHPKRSVHLQNPTHFSGLLSRTSTSLRATFDETSGETNKFTGERTDYVATLEDVPSVDNDVTLDKVTSVDNDVTLDKVTPVSQSLYDENTRPESPQDETSSDDPMLPLKEFLAKLNIQLDSEDSYSIFLYGGGAVVALWLLSAIVGSIDSIPVFPKLMEVVGLGYSVWFTTRYLLFKRNREELVSRIEELKREILGSSDE